VTAKAGAAASSMIALAEMVRQDFKDIRTSANLFWVATDYHTDALTQAGCLCAWHHAQNLITASIRANSTDAD
jgi:hypothetical protein